MQRTKSKTSKDEVIQSTMYRLKPEALKIGDVIASTAPLNPVSKVIRGVTKGKFSHVAVIVKDRTLYESVGKVGVRSQTTDKIFVSDPAYLAVYRPKPEIVDFEASKEKREALESACTDLMMAQYSVVKAIISVLPFRAWLKNPNNYFCSELVARAYMQAGVTLYADKSPEKITPEQVLRSHVFTQLDPSTLFEKVPYRGMRVSTWDYPGDETEMEKQLNKLARRRKKRHAKQGDDSPIMTTEELKEWNNILNRLSYASLDEGQRLALILKYRMDENATAAEQLKPFEVECERASQNLTEFHDAIIAILRKAADCASGATDYPPELHPDRIAELYRGLGMRYLLVRCFEDDLRLAKIAIVIQNKAAEERKEEQKEP